MSNANNDFSNTNTNIGSRLNNNRKEILIGVQHRGLVPTVVPREASLSNSSLFGAGKLKNRVSGGFGRPETVRRSSARGIEGPKMENKRNMHRAGFVIEEIVKPSNMEESFL